MSGGAGPWNTLAILRGARGIIMMILFQDERDWEDALAILRGVRSIIDHELFLMRSDDPAMSDLEDAYRILFDAMVHLTQELNHKR